MAKRQFHCHPSSTFFVLFSVESNISRSRYCDSHLTVQSICFSFHSILLLEANKHTNTSVGKKHDECFQWMISHFHSEASEPRRGYNRGHAPLLYTSAACWNLSKGEIFHRSRVTAASRNRSERLTSASKSFCGDGNLSAEGVVYLRISSHLFLPLFEHHISSRSFQKIKQFGATPISWFKNMRLQKKSD